MDKEEFFREGDTVVFAKLLWRGRVELVKGVVLDQTDKTIKVHKLECKSPDIENLYSYKRNKWIRVDKSKAMVINN